MLKDAALEDKALEDTVLEDAVSEDAVSRMRGGWRPCGSFKVHHFTIHLS